MGRHELLLKVGTLLAFIAAIAVGVVNLALRVPARSEIELVTGWPAFGFVVSTVILALVSACQWQASLAVQRERQGVFRRWVYLSVALATLFLGIQGATLARLAEMVNHAEVGTGPGPFVVVCSLLHLIHIGVGILALSYVAVQARAGRYDHEYWWGVWVCGWYWHILLLIWLAIFAVWLLAAITLQMGNPGGGIFLDPNPAG